MQNNQYLVDWFVPLHVEAVSLVFGLDKTQLDCTILMPDTFELFGRANLTPTRRMRWRPLYRKAPTKVLAPW